MGKQLSWQQVEMLILIGDWSDIDDEGRFWVPTRYVNIYTSSYSATLGRILIVEGAGSARTIRSLANRGLIKFIRGYESSLWCRITEEGRMLIESWRESGQWPVKVVV